MAITDAGFGSSWDQGAGTGEIEFALKQFYLPGMEEQKNNARVLLANIERNSKDVAGSYAYCPVLLGRNWGIGMREDRQPLPNPGYQRGARAQIPMRYAFGRLLVTLHAMTASKNTSGSYDTVLDVETEGMMEDLPKDINRQLFLDGTGRIGEAASLSSDTVTFDNSVLLAPTNSAEYTKYFEVGQQIDFYQAGGALRIAGLEVKSVDDNDEVTFTTTPTAVADTDLAYMAGNKGIEITGLLAMVSAIGTYQGIDRAGDGNQRWQSNVVSSSGDLTEAAMQTTLTSIQKASGMDPTIIVGTYEARDKYASILQTDRRFVNTIDYKGGFSGPEFHGLGLVPDTEAPRGHLFFLNLNYINIYQQAGLQFMDEDGAVLNRVTDYPAYEATLYWFFEMGTKRCNVHGRLTGINQ
jgi:hypothetical protein